MSLQLLNFGNAILDGIIGAIIRAIVSWVQRIRTSIDEAMLAITFDE